VSPQGSLFGDEELHRLVIDVRYDDLRSCVVLSSMAYARKGTLLASASLALSSIAQCELAPIWAAESLNGFMYRGAKEAVTVPSQALRARRKSLSL
jgi:hypothetical protein